MNVVSSRDNIPLKDGRKSVDFVKELKRVEKKKTITKKKKKRKKAEAYLQANQTSKMEHFLENS